jgi:hypothetical protein
VSADFDVLTMLAQLPPEEQEAALMEMFYPYANEQGALDQEMALAQQLRQRGPERGSPTGALFGGLSNALGSANSARLQEAGLKNQRALGGRMQGDATSRFKRLFQAMTQQQQGMPADDFDIPNPLS